MGSFGMHDPAFNVDDGTVIGSISGDMWRCGLCQAETVTIEIVELKLPPGDSSKILLGQAKATSRSAIGVGCGCYAKAHRQLAHIESRKRADERARKVGW